MVQMNAAQAQTNVYHPFPDSNAVWNFHYIVQCPIGGWPTPYADYSIYITGDTIINNVIYKKLYTPFVAAGPNPNNCPLPDSGYQGAIREDAIAKKVFIFPKYGMNEKLYFDFNWEAGDTIYGALGYSFQDTIVSVDSVLVGNSYRKRWLINSWYDTYVIEGIGSTYGLLNQSSYATDQPYYNLICFKQDNQTLYPYTATTCEIITVAVDEKENMDYGITIYPNPVSDELNITFNIEKPGNFTLQLYNSLGQEIKFLLSEKVNMGENNIKISVEDMPDGIYFLKLLINENIVTKKFTKK